MALKRANVSAEDVASIASGKAGMSDTFDLPDGINPAWQCPLCKRNRKQKPTRA